MSQDRIHSAQGVLNLDPSDTPTNAYPGQVTVGRNSGFAPGQGAGFGGALYQNHYPVSGNPTLVASNFELVHSGMGTIMVSAAGALTGMRIQAGSYSGQSLTILNECGSVMTFDVPSTSRVRGGTLEVVQSLAANQFTWGTLVNTGAGTNGSAGLWYKDK